MPRSTSQNFCCQCPCPHSELQPPPASAGDPPTLAGKSSSVSYRVTHLWEFLLPLPDPQLGKPDVGLRTFTPVGELLWYNCSPVCESSTQHLWDFILL